MYGAYIRHVHISHNTPCFPPKILHKHCPQFLFWRLYYPWEIKNKGYAKFGGEQGVLWEMFNWGICHLHISHNTAVQGETEDTAYAKFWWENKAYYGRSVSGEYVLVSI